MPRPRLTSFTVKPYKQSRTTKAKHIMPNGDIIKARQDLKNHEIWHLEVFQNGEQTNCLEIEMTADNCNRMLQLLTSWEPKAASSIGGNTYKKYRPTDAPFYKLHYKGKR